MAQNLIVIKIVRHLTSCLCFIDVLNQLLSCSVVPVKRYRCFFLLREHRYLRSKGSLRHLSRRCYVELTLNVVLHTFGAHTKAYVLKGGMKGPMNVGMLPYEDTSKAKFGS